MWAAVVPRGGGGGCGAGGDAEGGVPLLLRHTRDEEDAPHVGHRVRVAPPWGLQRERRERGDRVEP